MSVQMPEALYAGLQDLAKRERQPLQPLLRDILQAVVDGDDPGRVVSAGTREAIDALREQQGRDAVRWEAVMEAIEALGEKQRKDGTAGTGLVREDLNTLREKLDRIPNRDEAEWGELKVAFRRLEGNLGQLKDEVDRLLELQTPPAPDETRRRWRGPFSSGGG